MKKLLYLLLVFAVCFHATAYSQTIGNKNPKAYSKIPQEEIFLHYNTSLIQSGEKLYYKVYNINTKTKRLSSLSRIAYIELIDSDYKVHFKHKIWLDGGFGQGDFFVPTSISSGNYKLIAYTNWMKNGGSNNFFHDDITIINPFSDNSKFIVSESDSLQNKSNQDKIYKEFNNLGSVISLNLNKNEFSNREKIALKVDTKDSDILNGNYSVSVRKVEDIPYQEKHSSSTYTRAYSKSDLTNSVNNGSIIIPEFRGELIYGRVLNKSTNRVVPNADISLSIPGKDYVFEVSKTNSDGTFYFNVDRKYSADNAVVQILSKTPQDFKIEIDENTPFNYQGLTFKKFELNESYKDLITSRSIKNQIENAYNSIKQDSLTQPANKEKFYSSSNFSYVLDNYKRFKTLRETITEIIEYLYFTKKGEQYTILPRTKDIDASLSENDLLLVLVDGVFILDHNDIIDFNTEKVKKITVINNNFFYGVVSFKGLVDIETFDGNYQPLRNNDYSKNVNLFKPLTPKKYFETVYNDSNSLDRIPDFRNQLLWKPNVTLNENNSEINFYTSDLNGTYEINLEGFTEAGKPISIKKYFSVK